MQYSPEDISIGHLTDHLGWKRLRVRLSQQMTEITAEIIRKGFVGDANDVAKLNYMLGRLSILGEVIGIPDEVRDLSSSTP
jgi:hypothetical protein